MKQTPSSHDIDMLINEMALSDHPFHAIKKNDQGEKIVDRTMHPGLTGVFDQSKKLKHYEIYIHVMQRILQVRKVIGKVGTAYLTDISLNKKKPGNTRREHQKAKQLTKGDVAK